LYLQKKGVLNLVVTQTNVKIFDSFDSIIDYHNSLQAEEHEELRQSLIKKWKDTYITENVDIISDAKLWFLLVLNTLEARGRANKKSCAIALCCLRNIYRGRANFFGEIGVTLNEPYLHKDFGLVPSMSYIELGKHFEKLAEHFKITNSKKPPDIGVWQTVYLIVQAIYHKEERQADTWFQTAKTFYENYLYETDLNNNMPGLTFFYRGVRHDMLCPVAGTSDPDFLYKNASGVKFSAEFKRPTVTVDSLAYYAFKKPDYIYNADLLFTYGRTNAGNCGFYKIDYTKSPYTIEILPATEALISTIQRGRN
jgi:hypothetical protein